GRGGDRFVTLEVGGAGIAWTGVAVLVREGKPIAGKEYPDPRSPGFVVHPATFDLLLPPGRTVGGGVKDDVSGQPVAGVRGFVGGDAPETTTGLDGRFEVTGVAKEEKLRISAIATAETAVYLGSTIELPGDGPGLAPVTADIRVRKGIPLQAKVVEKGTVQPVQADVGYLILHPNAALPPDIVDVRLSLHRQPDGTYLGGAIPGPGAVVVRRGERRYVPSTANQKAFFKLERMPNVDYGGSENDLWLSAHRGAAPMPLPVRQFQVVEFINPAKDAAEVNVTLELDPGETKVLRLVDPDGRPLLGVKYKEFTEDSWSEPMAGPERKMTGVGRGLTRYQYLRHEGKKLAAAVAVTPDTPSPHTATLKSWASITGRLSGGEPRQVLYGLPEYATTDKDGRFRVEKLPPDHPLEVWVGQGEFRLGRFPEPVTLKPGEERDL